MASGCRQISSRIASLGPMRANKGLIARSCADLERNGPAALHAARPRIYGLQVANDNVADLQCSCPSQS